MVAVAPSPNERELVEGHALLEKYRILQKLGEGGFGRVYEAEELGSGRRVALKVSRSPEHRGRMAREARLAALLQSPHSVRVLGVESLDDGSTVIVMERLEGVSLREYLAMRGRVEPPLVLEWARQLAVALDEAHSLGLVHRDLKPSNLFLVDAEPRPSLKLLDFGLARAPVGSGERSVTGSEILLGSPAYMSPEQIRSGDVTPRSDIWSFGVVVHEMLAGRRPFHAESNAGMLAAIAADPPEPLGAVRRDLSPSLHDFVARCLRKRPEERFASAAALIEALDELGSSGALMRGADPITETLAADRARVRLRRPRVRHGLVLVGVFANAALWMAYSSRDTSAPRSHSPIAASVSPTAAALESAQASAPAPSEFLPVPAPVSKPAPHAAAPPPRPPSSPAPSAGSREPDQVELAGGERDGFFAEPDF